MQKTFVIYLLCVAFNILLIPGNTFAQINNDSLLIKSYELGNVVVTAGRTPIEAQKAARIVATISKTEIQKLPAQNFNDLLRFVSGVDIRQRGPLGAQADISIRGGTYDQTLILLNGVNITDPQTGHHNLNLPVDIESIERIEFLKGPAAKSFGPNAFNGAINIITGNSKPDHIRSSIMYGDYGLYRASVNISNKIAGFRHFITLSKISSDGYIKNTDFINTNIFYQANYKLNEGELDLQAGHNRKDFGANSFYSLKYPDQFEATRTDFLSLKYTSNTAIKFAPLVYLRRNTDRFELKRNNDSIPFNHHRTFITGVNLNLSTTNRLGRISLGIDFRNEHILSNVLGTLSGNPVEIPHFENSFYTKVYKRFNTSIYSEHSLTLDKLLITTGVMAHHNSDLTGLGFYPGIDISYRLKNNFRIYSSVNKTLRMPTFTDMFYKSPVQQGNPDIKPEEAVTVEGGLKYSGQYIKGHLSAFKRIGYNMIDWTKDPSPDSIIWRSSNFSRINFTGLEGSITITPENTRIESMQLSYSFLLADSTRSNILSKYAFDYLRHQITAGIDLRLVWKFFSSIRISYRDRNGSYQNASGQKVNYIPSWIADARIYWKGKHLTFYTEASNISGTKYYDFGGINQPGIWIRGGIALDFDYGK